MRKHLIAKVFNNIFYLTIYFIVRHNLKFCENLPYSDKQAVRFADIQGGICFYNIKQTTYEKIEGTDESDK